jgi:pyruvate formate lyase activating enzyme
MRLSFRQRGNTPANQKPVKPIILESISQECVQNLARRDFLEFSTRCLWVFCAAHLFGLPERCRAQSAEKGLIKAKLSPYFTRLDGGTIRCELCPRHCRIDPGKRGFCRVRENQQGQCYTLVYGNPCVIHVDPIERKPFFHVLPGTTSLSLATAGCNFDCKFCQTWEISQASPKDVYSYDMPADRVIVKAAEMGVRFIAYTYVEPIIFCEYMLDIGPLAKRAGLLRVVHSNGFINPEPLRDLCGVLDAANIDLKGFTETFYRELCLGELTPVLETLKTLKQQRIHLEITNLAIPLKNDDMSLVREMCLWVRKELGADTPVHFSRFYPLHKLRNLPPTPVSTLEQARAVALSAGLEYVYIGNVPGHEGGNTFCPRCKRLIIQRTGYMIGEIHLKDGQCGYCGKPIPGIWE